MVESQDIITQQEKWMKYFPLTTPRLQQKIVIPEIIKFFESSSDTQVVLLNAPTGVGKSAIGIGIANYFKNQQKETNYLVHNIYLEKQISKDYPFVSETMGRNNFNCIHLRDIARKLMQKARPIWRKNDLNQFLYFFSKKFNFLIKNDTEQSCTFCTLKSKKNKRISISNGRNAIQMSVCPDCLDKIKMIYGTGSITTSNGLCTHKIECDYSPKILGKGHSGYSQFAYFSKSWKKEKYWVNPIHCTYWDSKVNAINNPIVIHNYDYYLREVNNVGEFGDRYLTICDEGHKIEDVLLSYISLDVPFSRLIKYCVPYDSKKIPTCPFPRSVIPKKYIPDKSKDNKLFLKDWIKLLNVCLEYMTDNELDILNTFKIKDKKTYEIEEEKYHKFVDSLTDLSNNLDENNWVVQYSESGIKKMKSVEFKPINVNVFTKKYLLSHSTKFLIMSATLLDKNMMVKSLGLGKLEIAGKVRYIDMDSDFPKKNRMIYGLQIANMGYKYLPDSLPKAYDIITRILKKHANEKGIIHTKSYKLKNQIMQNVISDRFITHDPKDRVDKLNEYINSEDPLVLLSPSIEEGVDLKDDTCRFVIIPKIPYLFTLDEQINKKMKADFNWYSWKAVQTLIQSAGRGVRHKSDYCITYILIIV